MTSGVYGDQFVLGWHSEGGLSSLECSGEKEPLSNSNRSSGSFKIKYYILCLGFDYPGYGLCEGPCYFPFLAAF